jgi:hypothetical protein
MKSTSPSLQQALNAELARGETILWQGKPLTGLRVGVLDVMLGIASLAGLKRLLSMRGADVLTDGLGALSIVQVPFLAVSLFFTCFGQIFVDAAMRRHTLYCLTQRRALMITNLVLWRFQSVNLAWTSEIQCLERGEGGGTLVFGPRVVTIRGLPGSPRFASIPNVKSVHELAQRLASDARQATAREMLSGTHADQLR